MSISRLLMFATALAAAAGCSAAEVRYDVTVLGRIGSVLTTDPMDRVGLNAQGHAAFWTFDADSGTFRPTIYRDGAIVELGTVAGYTSGRAHAINDAGEIVGASGSAEPVSSGNMIFRSRQSFAVHAGVLRDYGGGGFSAAWSINNQGQATGEINGRATLWTNGVAQDLGNLGLVAARARGINDAGQIVGSSGSSSTRYAFLFENGAVRDLGTLGGPMSAAEGINARGQIVGFSADASGTNRAFLYENGTMRDLEMPAGATESRAHAINNSGEIVGHYRNPPGLNSGPRAFIYRDGEMTDLMSLLPVTSSGSPPVWLRSAGSINDAGQIGAIGSVLDGTGGGMRALLLTPLPQVQPATASVTAGSTVVFNAITKLSNAAAVQWFHNGIPIAGATQRTLRLNSVTTTVAGSYTCLVDDGNVQVASSAATLGVTGPTLAAGRLSNLSIRAAAGTGSETLIVGLTVSGGAAAQPKPLLIRAVGPGLAAYGVTGAMVNPAATLLSDKTPVRTNDDWDPKTDVAGAANRVGAFALYPDSRDAAFLNETPGGSYTVQVTGAGGSTGVALAEIYDASTSTALTADSSRLTNLSARTHVGNGADVLIAGFTIGGSRSKTLLVRAVGPTLAAFGLTGVLADPKLVLHGAGATVIENDNWGDAAELTATFSQLGAFHLDAGSKDAALLVTLPPGSYTAQISGADGGTGVALVEVYELP